MFGFKFVKFDPSNYVFVVKNGKTIKEGQGLSFWYFAPSTSFILIPIESTSAPFIFEEISSDYQTISIQGEIIFKISDTTKIKDQINFSVDSNSLNYISDDPKKLGQRMVNIIKTIAKKEIEQKTLKELLRSANELKKSLQTNTQSDPYINSIGIQITNINVLAITPTKDTSRALEAETRERIQKEADDAIYERRNFAVEQERKIKENELNTEIAIETKKRQIRETQLEAQKSVKEKEREMIAAENQFKIEQEKTMKEKQWELLAAETAFKIEQEKENALLVELSVKNKKMEAELKAYASEALMKTITAVPPETLRAISMSGFKADQLIASAFEDLAKNAGKIGALNISPELLSSLLDGNK
jgi:hypothetical protein